MSAVNDHRTKLEINDATKSIVTYILTELNNKAAPTKKTYGNTRSPHITGSDSVKTRVMGLLWRGIYTPGGSSE